MGAERFQIATDSTPNKRIRQTEPRRARVGQACATGSSVLAKNQQNVKTASVGRETRGKRPRPEKLFGHAFRQAFARVPDLQVADQFADQPGVTGNFRWVFVDL